MEISSTITGKHVLNTIKIPTFGGIQQSKSPLKIGDRKASACSNVRIDNPYGTLNNEIGMKKWSLSGAGQPINSLWQVKDKEIMFNRGTIWAKNAWVSGNENTIFTFSFSLISLNLYSEDIYYFDGYIYLIEGLSKKILKTDMLGNYSQISFSDSWATAYCFGIKIDEVNNKIYWINRASNSLRRCNLDGTNLETFGGYGSGVNQFNFPMDLFLDTSYTYAIQYDYYGNQNISGTMTDLPPTGTDPDGNIIGTWSNLNLYICDSENYRIVKTRFDGSIWLTIGSYKNPSTGYENFKFSSRPLSITYIKEFGMCVVREEMHRSSDGYKYISIIKFKFDGSYWSRTNFLNGSGDFQLDGDGRSFSSPNNEMVGRMIYYNNKLFITDDYSNSLIITDINFTTWKRLKLDDLTGTHFHPQGITVNRLTGEIFVFNPINQNFLKTSYFNQ